MKRITETKETAQQPVADGKEGGVSGQIALPFAHRPRFGRSDFVAAPSNAAARG
ncbi:chromosomal replication initiator protein DnaA, partial [Acetobacter malorum]